MCPGQSGKWVYSNSTVSLGESSNLTLTRVHFNDSGSYHYDSKIPCNFIVSVGGMYILMYVAMHVQYVYNKYYNVGM